MKSNFYASSLNITRYGYISHLYLYILCVCIHDVAMRLWALWACFDWLIESYSYIISSLLLHVGNSDGTFSESELFQCRVPTIFLPVQTSVVEVNGFWFWLSRLLHKEFKPRLIPIEESKFPGQCIFTNEDGFLAESDRFWSCTDKFDKKKKNIWTSKPMPLPYTPIPSSSFLTRITRCGSEGVRINHAETRGFKWL